MPGQVHDTLHEPKNEKSSFNNVGILDSHFRCGYLHQGVGDVDLAILPNGLLPLDGGSGSTPMGVLGGTGVPPGLAISGVVVLGELKALMGDQDTLLGTFP